MEEIHSALLEARKLGSAALATVAEMSAKMLGHMAKKCPEPEETGPDARDVSSFVSGGAWSRIFRASRSIPRTEIQAGDFPAHKWNGRLASDDRKSVRGRIVQVPQSHFQALVSAVDTLRPFLCGADPQELLAYITKTRVQRAKDTTSPIFILRSFREAVSEPIQATSDAGAIFELLRQVYEHMEPVR